MTSYHGNQQNKDSQMLLLFKPCLHPHIEKVQIQQGILSSIHQPIVNKTVTGFPVKEKCTAQKISDLMAYWMALPAPKSPLGMKKAPTQIPIMMRTLNNQNLKEK